MCLIILISWQPCLIYFFSKFFKITAHYAEVNMLYIHAVEIIAFLYKWMATLFNIIL